MITVTRMAAGVLLLWGATARAAQLEQLAFLSGHWIGGDGAYEEVWLEPRAGTLAGSFRWVFPDGRQVLEYLVIEETESGVLLRFKHFDTDYEPWEKDEPNAYRLMSVDGPSATFERISDSARAPKTLVYARNGEVLTFRGHGDRPDEEPLVLEFERRATGDAREPCR